MADEPTTPPAEKPEEPKTVPYARFQEVNEQHRSLKQQLADLTSQNAKLSRGQLLVEAARKAGFADPTDAAALIDAGSIESEAQARRAVKDLAESKPHLVAKIQEQPEIGQILQNGEPVDPTKASDELR